MTLRLLALAAGLAVALASAAHAADDVDVRLAAARAMLDAGHTGQLEDERIALIVGQAKAQMRETRPGVSDSVADHYGEVLQQELGRDKTKLIDLRAQYYAQHFTAEELKAWTEMLNSTVGRKITDTAPEIMRDFYSVDQVWAKDAMQRTAQRLETESASP